jgi:hypothetical protein
MIDRLLDVPGVRQEAARRGLAQAARYNWDRCAMETFALYARVAGRAAPALGVASMPAQASSGVAMPESTPKDAD